jgi:Na+-driven multidrug efflux pump
VASLATQYVWYVAPSVLSHTQAVTAIGYAEAQKYTFSNLFVLFGATLIHIILTWTFVGVLDMGWNGVCLATSL